MKKKTLYLTVFLFIAASRCSGPEPAAPPSSLSRAGGEKSDPARVALVDFRDEKTIKFVLVNEASTAAVDNYKKSTLDLDTKIIKNPVMSELLSFFDQQGFFTYALQGATTEPGEWKGKARSMISLQVGNRSYVFPHRRREAGAAKVDPGVEKEVETFIDLKKAVILIYNETPFPRFVKNPYGGKLFDIQQKKLMEERKD